jgi:hypothetical protein
MLPVSFATATATASAPIAIAIAIIGIAPAVYALYKTNKNSKSTRVIKEVLDNSSSMKSLDQVIRILQDQVDFLDRQVKNLQAAVIERDKIIDGLRKALK